MGEAVLRSPRAHRRSRTYRRAGSTLDSTEVWGRSGRADDRRRRHPHRRLPRADGKALVDFAGTRARAAVDVVGQPGRACRWTGPTRCRTRAAGWRRPRSTSAASSTGSAGRAAATRTGSTTKPTRASVDRSGRSPYRSGPRRTSSRRATAWSASAVYVAKWWTQGGRPWPRWPTCTTRRGGWWAVLASDRPPSTTTTGRHVQAWDATVAYALATRCSAASPTRPPGSPSASTRVHADRFGRSVALAAAASWRRPSAPPPRRAGQHPSGAGLVAVRSAHEVVPPTRGARLWARRPPAALAILVVLGLLAGLSGASAIAALSGARQADTAFERCARPTAPARSCSPARCSSTRATGRAPQPALRHAIASWNLVFGTLGDDPPGTSLIFMPDKV